MNPVLFCQKESFPAEGNGCLWCLLAYRRSCWPLGSLSIIGACYTVQSPRWPPGPSSPQLLVLLITHDLSAPLSLFPPLPLPPSLALSVSCYLLSLAMFCFYFLLSLTCSRSYFLFLSVIPHIDSLSSSVIPHIHSLSCSLANSLSPLLSLALLSPGRIHSAFFSLCSS